MPFKFFSKEGFERVTALANQDVELDYAQIVANSSAITATTEGTSQTIIAGNSISCDGLTKLKIEFFYPQADVNSSNVTSISLVLFRDSTPIGISFIKVGSGAGANIEAGARTFEWFDTPAAGAHTYTVKAYVNSNSALIMAGTGATGTLRPAFLRVTRVTQQVTTFPESVMEVADGDVPVWDSASQSWKGQPGGLSLIQDILLGSSQSSIDLTDIPQIFKHLVLETVLRDDGASSGQAGAAWIQFNADGTGANYIGYQVYGYSGISTPGGGTCGVGANGVQVIPECYGGYGTDAFFASTAKILNYKEARKKSGHVEGGVAVSATVSCVQNNSFGYLVTTAISRITLRPGNGTNFVAGSRATLYGLS